MNNKQTVEYLNKDVPTIKRDIRLRMLFAVLFIVAFVWQIIMLFKLSTAPSVLMIVLAAVTMIFSTMYAFTSILYAINGLRNVERVKHRGKSASRVNFVMNIDKRSFIHLYSFITRILSIVALALLVSAATYSLLSFVYYNQISFYLPAIFAFVCWCFNSSYHIKNEIYVFQNVNRYNSIYY